MTSEHFNTAGRDVKTGLTASVSPNSDPLLLPLQPPTNPLACPHPAPHSHPLQPLLQS